MVKKLANLKTIILQELNNLKKKGNEYRIKISELEEKQRILDKQIDNEIYNLPNFPSKDAPIGKR